MLYPKIQSLYKRDKNNKYVIMPGNYSKEEFLAVQKWRVSEKIHGMNIRIIYNQKDGVRFGGRTDNAHLPTRLYEYLFANFTNDRLASIFPDLEDTTVVLYGEGYGAGINKGGGYQQEQRFILFDVRVGHWWLTHESVKDIAANLGIPVVHDHGVMTLQEIEDWFKYGTKFVSRNATSNPELVMEGIVARSEPLMLFRDGKPLMFKLKVQDYIDLRKHVK
jgi:hypothetical protein